MKKILTLIVMGVFLTGTSLLAMDHSKMDKGAMDHSKMDHGTSHDGKTMKHEVMVDGIHTEFQVMDLASMNMKDKDGRTHHVMVTFMKDGEKITKAVGKVKIISPSKKEQTAALENFGNGVYAANFTFDEEGKWGVICLFKADAGKHTAKFWYTHNMM